MRNRDIILQMKYARIIALIAETQNISIESAMEIFYNSETFGLLSDEKNGLFTMSDKYLADDICREKTNAKFLP